jgi:hypothetical protein
VNSRCSSDIAHDIRRLFAEQISHVAPLTSATRGVFRGLPSYFVRALGYRAGTSEPPTSRPPRPKTSPSSRGDRRRAARGASRAIGLRHHEATARHGRRSAGGIVAEGAGADDSATRSRLRPGLSSGPTCTTPSGVGSRNAKHRSPSKPSLDLRAKRGRTTIRGYKLLIVNHPMTCNRYGFPGHLPAWNTAMGRARSSALRYRQPPRAIRHAQSRCATSHASRRSSGSTRHRQTAQRGKLVL